MADAVGFDIDVAAGYGAWHRLDSHKLSVAGLYSALERALQRLASGEPAFKGVPVEKRWFVQQEAKKYNLAIALVVKVDQPALGVFEFDPPGLQLGDRALHCSAKLIDSATVFTHLPRIREQAAIARNPPGRRGECRTIRTQCDDGVAQLFEHGNDLRKQRSGLFQRVELHA